MEARAKARAFKPAAREGQAGSYGMAERSVVPVKRVTTVEGRDLS
jgi:hypothetical protein